MCTFATYIQHTTQRKNMRKERYCLQLLVAALSTVAFTACNPDDVESAVDTLPMPSEYEANKDKSVKPGDSFFDYCNGSWLAAHPIPTDPTVNLGGLYGAAEVMEQRVEQLKKSNPDIGRYYTLVDEIHEHSKAARQYIAEQKAKMQKPASKEEAFRAIGRMYLEGVNVLGMSYMLYWDQTQLKGILLPVLPSPIDDAFLEEIQTKPKTSLLETRAGSAPSVPKLLAEGMGLDLSLVKMTDEVEAVWQAFWDDNTLDQLYQKMQDAWSEYEAYADLQGLDDFNATHSKYERQTVESLRNNARAALGYTLSYHFQQQFLTQEMKDKYLGITKEIQAALRKRIQKVDWMSETTKQNAIDKVDHYTLNVAFPDTWHTDCIPALANCGSMAEALHRVKAGNARLEVALTGTNEIFSNYLTQTSMDSNGNPMSMDLTLVNATYSPQTNSVTIYPAMLMPPMMPEEGYSDAAYYAVFSIIGHEFTHGFDNNGAQWDKYGQKNNWWAVTDMMNFQDRKQNLIRCYSNMELDPQRSPLTLCNGERTQGENIADLGGFLAALDAYKVRLDAQGFTGEARKEQIRKFYEAYAHLWCIQYGATKFNILVNSDVHAHARLRINGVVMNTDQWYTLYGVTRDNLLYLPKDRRAYIW